MHINEAVGREGIMASEIGKKVLGKGAVTTTGEASLDERLLNFDGATINGICCRCNQMRVSGTLNRVQNRKFWQAHADMNVIEIGIYLDPGLQALAVLVLECLLDVTQIDLRPADDDADQRLVLGAQAGHGVVQALRKVVDLGLAALDCKARHQLEGTLKNRML